MWWEEGAVRRWGLGAGHRAPSPAMAAAPLRAEAGGVHLPPLPAAMSWARCPPSTRLGRSVGQEMVWGEGDEELFFLHSFSPSLLFFVRFIVVRL